MRLSIDDILMIQMSNGFYITLLTFELNSKSTISLETWTQSEQTLCADFDNDCNQSGFLSLSADGDCKLSNLDLLAGTGLGD